MNEKVVTGRSGFKMLGVEICLFVIAAILFLYGASAPASATIPVIIGMMSFLLTVLLFIFIAAGFFVLQPNEACALVLFGVYKGTVKNSGFLWANPFNVKKRISLRFKNIDGEKLKVNDEAGNPIEIAAVIVWQVSDVYKALFEVENYGNYVTIQSEAALRHLASKYPYDVTEQHHELSLRGSTDEVIQAFKNELNERLEKAGVVVTEARFSHLAYAPEIAAAMLQRQQASAIVAARTKIVEGAVGMVQLALAKLSEEGIVRLDEERKAAMVSNLLVVLCGERASQPIVNTGTLYN